MQQAINLLLLEDAKMRLTDLHKAYPKQGYDKMSITSLRDYLKLFQTGRLWAGDQELALTCIMLKRSIQVCTRTPTRGKFAVNSGLRRDPPEGPTDVIYIYYNGTSHYEGLQMVQLIT